MRRKEGSRSHNRKRDNKKCDKQSRKSKEKQK
jgi:hypothetical protein